MLVLCNVTIPHSYGQHKNALFSTEWILVVQWAQHTNLALVHTAWFTLFSAMILVKQCKHITTAHLRSLSLHYGRLLRHERYGRHNWDICLPSFFPHPNFNFHFHFHLLLLLFTLLLCLLLVPSGNSLPTLPSPSSPLRTRTCVISYSQPATGEYPNSLAINQNYTNGDFKVRNSKCQNSHWEIPLAAHDIVWTWTCSPELAGFLGLDQPTLFSWVFSLNTTSLDTFLSRYYLRRCSGSSWFPWRWSGSAEREGAFEASRPRFTESLFTCNCRVIP